MALRTAGAAGSVAPTRHGLRRERYNINNKNDYGKECNEFGYGYNQYHRHVFHRSGVAMHLNAHKIKFCLHMLEFLYTFAH